MRTIIIFILAVLLIGCGHHIGETGEISDGKGHCGEYLGSQVIRDHKDGRLYYASGHPIIVVDSCQTIKGER